MIGVIHLKSGQSKQNKNLDILHLLMMESFGCHFKPISQDIVQLVSITLDQLIIIIAKLRKKQKAFYLGFKNVD